MTDQEFERLQRRFGADVSAWPAPYRQAGLPHLARDAHAAADGDAALDAMILAAAAAPTDEQALTRNVLARIDSSHRRLPTWTGIWRMWTMPAAASAFAAILVVATIAGYAVAESGANPDDDALLAYALGGGLGGEILDETGGGEEQL